MTETSKFLKDRWEKRARAEWWYVPRDKTPRVLVNVGEMRRVGACVCVCHRRDRLTLIKTLGKFRWTQTWVRWPPRRCNHSGHFHRFRMRGSGAMRRDAKRIASRRIDARRTEGTTLGITSHDLLNEDNDALALPEKYSLLPRRLVRVRPSAIVAAAFLGKNSRTYTHTRRDLLTKDSTRNLV